LGNRRVSCLFRVNTEIYCSSSHRVVVYTLTKRCNFNFSLRSVYSLIIARGPTGPERNITFPVFYYYYYYHYRFSSAFEPCVYKSATGSAAVYSSSRNGKLRFHSPKNRLPHYHNIILYVYAWCTLLQLRMRRIAVNRVRNTIRIIGRLGL